MADADRMLDDTGRRLADLEAAARGFGDALTAGLRAAVVEGRSLDDVLRQVALRLSASVLSRALEPLSDLVGGIAGGLAGRLAGAIGGAAPGPAAAPPAAAPDRLAARPAAGAAGVQVTMHVTTPDAESFRRSEAQVSAMLARAVGRGRRGL